MAVNTAPIFSKRGDIQWAPVIVAAANTTRDGTGAVSNIFTAGVDGAFVHKVLARALGTNVATVLRVFVNNGGNAATTANNSLIAEMTLPATSASESAALAPYELPMNFPLPANYILFCTLGTAVAAGYKITTFGGSYTE
jgi:hypothetical protein